MPRTKSSSHSASLSSGVRHVSRVGRLQTDYTIHHSSGNGGRRRTNRATVLCTVFCLQVSGHLEAQTGILNIKVSWFEPQGRPEYYALNISSCIDYPNSDTCIIILETWLTRRVICHSWTLDECLSVLFKKIKNVAKIYIFKYFGAVNTFRLFSPLTISITVFLKMCQPTVM